MRKSIVGLLLIAMVSATVLGGCKKNDNQQMITEALKEYNEQNNLTNETVSTEITVVRHFVTCNENGKELGKGEYPEIIFSENYQNKYPTLWATIQEYNKGWESDITRCVSQNSTYAKDREDYVAEDKITVEILCANDQMFTVLVNSFDDNGGAHPSHACNPLSLNPETGCSYMLSDVLNNGDCLPESIYEELKDECDAETMQAIEDYLTNPDFGQSATVVDYLNTLKDSDMFTWYISDAGLNIYFNAYDIAPYAYGDIQVILYNEDYPNLIKSEYQLEASYDASKLVEEKDGDTVEVEPSEVETIEEEDGSVG